ncbi:MAG: acetyl-CoA C-acetyltransferase [Oscillospiraceae bacterium]|nr:acetyl-CoA C-acetyltransferase [Oscillospiraceae bacterium]
MKDIYLASCCRTAIGNFGGALANTSAVKLGETVAKAAIARTNLEPEDIDEVMFGSILTAGLGQNISRQIAIGAGIPVETPAYTCNMMCGSGMKTVIDAARAIIAGDAEIVLAGGTENMSAAPYVSSSVRYGARMGDTTLVDTMIYDGLTDVFNKYHMGITAENICDKWGLAREELDAFALASQTKAAAAIAAGKFKDEIEPVQIKVKKDIIAFDTDEYPRKTTIESLAKLRPAFKPDGGRVTAGNASGINDGAAALIIASGDAVAAHKLKPIAKLLSWGQGGVDPSIMGIGPVPASRQAFERAGLTIGDMDLVEANEAFAAQSIAVARDLGFDMEKVNVNGGAIALGHPIGASGARIIVTLIHEMRKRGARHGLATLCIGGGMGVATVWELA